MYYVKKTFLLISLLLVLRLTAGVGYAAQIPIPAGFPNADTTGIKGAGLTESDLTTYTGSMTITTDGTVLDKYLISGQLGIDASNVTVKRCKLINGGWYGIKANYAGRTGTLIEDCTVTDGASKAILATNTTIRRCDISAPGEGEDAISHGSNITVEDCYIHDLINTTGGHIDGIECSAGSNIVVRHNTIQGPYQDQTAAIGYHGSTTGILDTVLIENNFLSGGSYTVYVRDGGGGDPVNVTVQNNVFEYDSYAFGHISTDGEDITYLCNVWDDGSPIPENPACEPNQPTGDFNGDGVVDFKDVKIMTDHWLVSDYDLAGTLSVGLVSHYKFDGDANDSVGGNDGTEVGNPTYSTGLHGQAIRLDGDGDYVNCGNDSSFNITGSITLSALIKGTFNSGWDPIIAKSYDWMLSRGTGDEAAFFCIGVGSVLGTTNINDDQWHYVAAVYDGSKMYLYVDGVQDAYKSLSGSLNVSASSVYIGGSPSQSFNGLIDDVLIYGRALSEEEIQELACPIDLNTDGSVNFKDFAELADNWLR